MIGPCFDGFLHVGLDVDQREADIENKYTFFLQQRECKNIFQAQLSEFFSNNAGSVKDPFVLWNAHKAFMRGICIQSGAREKRRRQKRLQDLTTEINTLDNQNKSDPSLSISQKIIQLRFDLRL